MQNSIRLLDALKMTMRAVLVGTLGLLAALPAAAQAAITPVSVVTNQASQPVAFWVSYSDGQREAKQLNPGESLAVACFHSPEAIYQPKDTPVRTPLFPDSIQVFTDHTGVLELLFLGPQYSDAVAKATVELKSKATEGVPVLTIPVRIYMDAGMPLKVDIWKARIQERFQQASAILEQACQVELEIRDFAVWQSKPGSPDLPALLKDFEKQIPPEPGVLHIGFTNHPNFKGQGTVEMGIARLPFQASILLREEAPQMTDVERLNVLLHEIGHFLGAVHTTDMNSIMRPVSKDRRERSTAFHMAYDPLNVLAMNLWLREYRANGQKQVTSIRRDTREKLKAIYHMVLNIAQQQAEAMGTPVEENPNIELFLVMLGEAPAKNLVDETKKADGNTLEGQNPDDEKTEKKATEGNETAETDHVAKTGGAVTSGNAKEEKNSPTSTDPNPSVSKAKANWKVRQAERQAAANAEMDETLKALRTELLGDGWTTEAVAEYTLPSKTTRFVLATTLLAMRSESFQKAMQAKLLKGDAYTELIVRLAATAALEVGGKENVQTEAGRNARQAFVLALETLLEPSGRLQTLPIYGKRFATLETAELRKIRRRTVVSPTIFGRGDLCQHFWVSAALATHLDSKAVEIIGLEKERHDDLPGGSGFDVTDLNADMAGIVFAEKVLDGTLSLEKLARGFQFKQVIPTQINLPKELKHPETPEQEDETLRRLRQSVEAMYGN